MKPLVINYQMLSVDELKEINGGSMSEVGRAIVKFFGTCFIQPAVINRNMNGMECFW